MATAWIQIARNAPFFQLRHHLWWTLLSVLWSNMLTPQIFVQPVTMTGQDLDFLNPTLSNYLLNTIPWPSFPPMTQNYSLVPSTVGYSANVTGDALIHQQHAKGDNNGDKEGRSSSPTIALNDLVIVAILSSNLNYTFQTWSWSTNCSGNAESYTGDVNILMSNDNSIGNGLFTTSVCVFQDFSGPSNQSFLVVMKASDDSRYCNTYFGGNPDLPIVCQVTPVVTTLEVQYNENGLGNVSRILNRTLLPDDSGRSPRFKVSWFGLYSNSLADDLDPYLGSDFAAVLSIRADLMGMLESEGQGLPDNMTIPFTGTMNVALVGQKFNLRTHGIALGLVTLVTIMTTMSGGFALLEANKQKMVRDSLERGSAARFDPTSLMDVLVVSSMGNLASVLSEHKAEEDLKELVVKLGVTDGSQSVLNARADDTDDVGGEPKGKAV
ncbi:hypothetical protein V8E55_010654 [Tylopilus felleus]